MSDPISEIQKLQASLPTDTPENAAIREDLLLEARKLMLSLERPDNAVSRICFQIWETITTRIAVDLGIFKTLTENSSPQTVEDLVKHTNGADPILVGRLMRCLESHGIVEGDATGYTAATPAKAFADPKFQATIEFLFNFCTPDWLALPSFLASTSYQNPTSGTHTPIARAYNGMCKTLELSTKPITDWQSCLLRSRLAEFGKAEVQWSTCRMFHFLDRKYEIENRPIEQLDAFAF